jgi:hypothetical protein
MISSPPLASSQYWTVMLVRTVGSKVMENEVLEGVKLFFQCGGKSIEEQNEPKHQIHISRCCFIENSI